MLTGYQLTKSSFYEVQDEFDFDSWVEESGHEDLGILYMRKDKSGHCVSWNKEKGFLDYSKSKTPKPSPKDGTEDIKSLIELIFTVEESDWTNEETEKTPQKDQPEPKGGKKPATGTKKKAGEVAPKKKVASKKAGAEGESTLAKRPKAKKPAADDEEEEEEHAAPKKPVVKKKAPVKKEAAPKK